MARVDIVMPLYNKAATVARAIRSVQGQVWQDWRLLIVDDGSTDNGADIVRATRDDRIELIQQENQGPGAARNAGLACADAQYVAFLDADDEWHTWYLTHAVDALEKSGAALVATMYYEWPRQTDMTKHWARRGVYYGEYTLHGHEDPEWAESLLLFLHVGNSLIRTETARKYGGFYADQRCVRGEDTIFFMRVGINEKLKIIGPPAVRHHREDSGLSHMKDYPLPPLFVEPELILRYCPPHKRDLMKKIIARLALRTAQYWARHGLKQQALDLLRRFPHAKKYRRPYYRCRSEVALSSWFAYRVHLSYLVGPSARRFLKSWAWRLRLQPSIPHIAQLDHSDDVCEE